MATTNDLKNGMVLNLDNQLWSVVEFQHVKPGKGPAFVRTKIKNVLSGKIVDKTFNAGTKVETANVDRRTMQYLYTDGDVYTFMDTETYEQLELQKDFVGDRAAFLQDGMTVTVELYEEKPIGISLPDQVVLEVTEADPVVKGQTAASSYKPAVMENGVRVMVPPFITAGERIIVDTNEITYVRRAD